MHKRTPLAMLVMGLLLCFAASRPAIDWCHGDFHRAQQLSAATCPNPAANLVKNWQGGRRSAPQARGMLVEVAPVEVPILKGLLCCVVAAALAAAVCTVAFARWDQLQGVSRRFELLASIAENRLHTQRQRTLADVGAPVLLACVDYGSYQRYAASLMPGAACTTECYICLLEFELRDRELDPDPACQTVSQGLKLLPCRHVFHDACVSRWLANNNPTCPVCRAFVLDAPAQEVADGDALNQLQLPLFSQQNSWAQFADDRQNLP